MKIVVACMNGKVSEHFGHCECFMLGNVEDNKLQSLEKIDYPGHKPGFLPNFLADLHADVVITGGMGQGAIDIFTQRGIKIVTGAQGPIEYVINEYLNNNLVSTKTVCNKHEHADECH